MAAHRINPRQQQFVENYLKTGNASLAYRMINPIAKNPDENACKLLKKESVQLMVRNAQEKANQQIVDTYEWKVNRLRTFIDECSKVREVYDEEGNLISSSIPPDYINAGTRAIAELNKMQGHYAPEKHVNVNIEGSIDKIRQTLIDYEKY